MFTTVSVCITTHSLLSLLVDSRVSMAVIFCEVLWSYLKRSFGYVYMYVYVRLYVCAKQP